eukprot:CAMPEP_0179078952 /NCGR_PEP_ID=MMETSP0796-20121207/35394_1 /TAXON_ID=73915 /ORGANISM="Pyrodinium bahamense, Strain pbaha01" /LENGTH=42 /DNA_ID= /DNA_START= /DNA_END= /DNA_ORIENTATION=
MSSALLRNKPLGHFALPPLVLLCILETQSAQSCMGVTSRAPV